MLAILGAVLFPVFAQNKGSRRSVALSNVKVLGLGAMMYANDFDDHFPNARKWMDLTMPYVKFDAAFHAYDLPDPSPQAYGIAFRGSLSRGETKRIKEPEMIAMIFDSTLLFRNAASELWSLPKPPRHKGVTNLVAFADGHARGVTQEASQNLR